MDSRVNVTTTTGSAASVTMGPPVLDPYLREYLEMRRRALYQELRYIERVLGTPERAG